MNSVRQIQELNKRELEDGVSPEASWHADYRDTAYIYIGGLPFELSEGDIITIFSQFGEPTYVKLVRDKDTGKSRGFAFLKYEDQRSTDLAVDNLGGAVLMGRTLRVDHTRYKKRDDESDDRHDVPEGVQPDGSHEAGSKGLIARVEESAGDEKQLLPEERELAKLIEGHDDDDPMKPFLVEEMKEKLARARSKDKEKDRQGTSSRHGHRHKSRRDPEGTDGDDYRRSHHKSTKSSHRKETSREGRADSKQDYRRRPEVDDFRDGPDQRTRDRGALPRPVESSRERHADVYESRRRR